MSDSRLSHRQFMERTGYCEACGHAADKHYRHQCHEIRVWVPNGTGSPHSRCGCTRLGPEDFAAGDAWNSYLGRTS